MTALRFKLAVLLVAVLSAPVRARAEEPFLRDAYGWSLSTVGEHVEGRSRALVVRSEWIASIETGPTFPVGYDGGSIVAFVRQSVLPDLRATQLLSGYRGYFGEDSFRTFWDLDLVLNLRPEWKLGPRLGFGLQWEVTPWLGTTVFSGAQVGGGDGWRFSAELGLGAQLRW